MRDERGDRVHNAHLLGFFRRIAKLMFHHIKPGTRPAAAPAQCEQCVLISVFVFDGATPALKARTVAQRRSNRDRSAFRIKRVAEKLLLNTLHQQAIANPKNMPAAQPAPAEEGAAGKSKSSKKRRRKQAISSDDEARI